VTIYRLRRIRGPEWIPSTDETGPVIFAIHFEARARSGRTGPGAPGRLQVRLDLELAAGLLERGRWAGYSARERAAHLMAIAREHLERHGLPRAGSARLAIDAETEGGRFSTGSPFDPAAPMPDEPFLVQGGEPGVAAPESSPE
jgi:hypothetical protein